MNFLKYIYIRWKGKQRNGVGGFIYKNGRAIGELKIKPKWDKLDNKGSKTNVKTLHCISNCVSFNEFCRSATYKYVKETWNSNSQGALLLWSYPNYKY